MCRSDAQVCPMLVGPLVLYDLRTFLEGEEKKEEEIIEVVSVPMFMVTDYDLLKDYCCMQEIFRLSLYGVHDANSSPSILSS